MSEFNDEPNRNPSDNEPFSAILERSWSRRHVMKGGLGLAAVTLFGGFGIAAANGRPAARDAEADTGIALGFDSLPGSKTHAVVVPAGYMATVLAPWGTPLNGEANLWKSDGGNTADDQLNAVGMHHDGMHFFPIDGRSDDGLLVINNEYIDQDALHPSGASEAAGKRPADEVRKEINAHGVSVVRITRVAGQWRVSERDPLNRRVTSATLMALSGPLAETDHVKTAFSKDGTLARGTNNNCGNGYTPWGTYLTCEENWPDVFVNRADTLPADQRRLGIPTDKTRFGWETAAGDPSEKDGEFARFDLTPKGTSASDDYRNEASTFGYIVEIDPFDADRRPIKRTALGRFRHEGCWPGKLEAGKPVVFYSGHDARFEYIYKFVSSATWNPADAEPTDRLATGAKYMDDGTLFVARFNDDGSGEWLALTPATATRDGSTLGEQLGELADIILNTAHAADLVGATPMDRPEWGTVDPTSGDVYMTLTNNDERGQEQLDAANPRPSNVNGQIIRWRENDGQAGFRWDIFVFGADAEASAEINRSGLTPANQFASPDGLVFDNRGILWIQTDNGDNAVAEETNNQMLAVVPANLGTQNGQPGIIDAESQSQLKRFLVGPNGSEVTGFAATPDNTSIFVNIQHPENWPYRDDASAAAPEGTHVRPRSSTVVIQKIDGGAVGV